MKLQKLLEDTIKTKINPRKPLFFSRVKMFILASRDEWIENCRGMLIFYTHETFHYISIMNIMKFQIDFDMELYTNFLNYCKFMGDTKSAYFLLPSQSRLITVMLVFESKQELLEFKRKLQSEFYISQTSAEFEFLKRPDVQQLIGEAQISQKVLESELRFKGEVQAAIKAYLQEIQELDRNVKHSGFKAYGLGREQWKFEQNQKEFMKQKKKTELIAALVKINKQNKIL